MQKSVPIMRLMIRKTSTTLDGKVIYSDVFANLACMSLANRGISDFRYANNITKPGYARSGNINQILINLTISLIALGYLITVGIEITCCLIILFIMVNFENLCSVSVG